MTDAASERDLVRALNAGDTGAFETLFRAHGPWVQALAHRFSGSSTDAEDVVQETFAYLLGKLPHLTLTARLRTFLYPVVKHLARRAAERRGRFTTEEAAFEAALDAAPMDAAPGVEDARARLAPALAALSAAQREVVLLRVVDDFSLDEIAAALDVPVGTVKSRLHHALHALREDPRARSFFDDPPVTEKEEE